MMIRTLSVFVLSGLFLARGALADPLTLDNYLKKLEASDTEYSGLLLQAEKASYYIDSELPTRAFELSLSNENGQSSDNQDTQTTSLGLSKTILESGTTVSATKSLTKSPGRDEDVTEIRLTQSLFKNFLGKNFRLQKNAVERRQVVEDLQAQENIETYLSEKIKGYLDFVQAYSDLNLSKQLVAEAKKLRQFVQEKQRKGAATATDLKRVQLQEIQRQEELIGKQQTFDELVAAISGFIGGGAQVQVPLEGASIDRQFPFNQSGVDISSLRTYRISYESKEASYFDQQVAERASYSSLDLVAGYDIDNSTRFSTTTDRQATVIGFSYSIPLGDTKSAAQLEVARLERTRAERELSTTQRDLEVEYKNLKKRLDESKRRVDLSQRKVRLMKDILAEDLRRYRYGKIDLDSIIELNNSYAQYQFDFSQYQIEYGRVYVDWLNFHDALYRP